MDSYRRDKGLAAPAEQGNGKTSLLERASKGLTGVRAIKIFFPQEAAKSAMRFR